jgi:Trk K+ transport system NAD-binding subunit
MSHFIVCGLGQVGYRVTNLLLDLGESVTVVTVGSQDEWVRTVCERGARLIHGDARDDKILGQADLTSAQALLACTSNDLTNIQIAMDARHLAPDLRIIARIFEQELARQVQQSIGIHAALAMSMLAAPAFAVSAFGDRITTEFSVDEHRFLIARLEVDEASPLLGKSLANLGQGNNVSVLLKAGSDCGMDLQPRAEDVLKPGDVLKIVGLTRDVPALVPSAEFRPKGNRDAGGLGSAVLRVLNPLEAVRFVRRVWQNATVELRALTLIVSVMMVLSVLVFSRGMNLSLGDALYFVITTLTTTGYGDISPMKAGFAVKLYACFMMVLGSATIAVLYSIITDYIVTSRLQQLVGRQKIEGEGHVVVAGIGDVGYRTVEELSRMGARIVVVDTDPSTKYLTAVRNRASVVIGDAREAEILVRAGVETAAATLATTGDDAVNLSIGLAAKRINPSGRSVLRAFDGDFAAKVQHTLSIDAAMSASRIAAPSFVAAALYEGLVAAFVLRGNLFAICRAKGDEGGRALFVVGADGPRAVGPGEVVSGDADVLVAHGRPLTDNK